MLGIAFFVCTALIVAASIPCWKRLLTLWQGRQPFIEPRLRIQSPIGLLDLGLAICIWLILQIVAGSVLAFATQANLAEPDSLTGDQFSLLMLVLSGTQFVACLFIAGLLLGRYQNIRVLGWPTGSIANELRLALVAFLVFAPIMLLIQTALAELVKYEHPVMQALLDNANAFTIATVWVTAVVFAPITEEFFFRGMIQNWLQRWRTGDQGEARLLLGGWWANEELGSAEPVTATGLVTGDSTSQTWNWWAIVISSALFAVAHWGQGLAPIPLFGFSIVLGYLYQRTGSLLPSIALHMMLNSFSVFWLTLQILFPESDMISNLRAND